LALRISAATISCAIEIARSMVHGPKISPEDHYVCRDLRA
jgi:hypothetical protein